MDSTTSTITEAYSMDSAANTSIESYTMDSAASTITETYSIDSIADTLAKAYSIIEELRKLLVYNTYFYLLLTLKLSTIMNCI